MKSVLVSLPEFLRRGSFGALLAAVVLLLTSCSGASLLSDSGQPTAKGRTVPPVSVQQVTGLPPAKLSDMKTALAVAGGQRDIGIVEGSFQSGSFSLTGQFRPVSDNAGVRIIYQWQLRDTDGVLVQTIDGEDNAGLATGSDPWAAVSSTVIDRIARRTIETMAAKLSELGYATRLSRLEVPPAEYFVMAGPGAQREIDFETLNGPGMAMAGADFIAPPDDPAMAAAFVEPVPGEAQMLQAAADAVPEPKTPASATGADSAANAKTKPNSDTKVEIRAVAVVPVKGSPGGGDAELTAAMRKTLSSAGWPVVTSRQPDALTIVGLVKLADKSGPGQTVSVRWDVQSPDGKSLGDVKQANDIPAGALDRGWGQAANAVTEAAATGIFDIVNRFQ